MSRVALSRLPDWNVLEEDQDIRGLRLQDEAGHTVGLITDLIVDEETGYVDAILLDTGEEVSADDIEIGRDIVFLHRSFMRQPPSPKAMVGREEAIGLQRVPVHKPANEGEVDGAFREGIFEVRARGEQLDIGKRLLLVEEIHINKDVVERAETVQDAVRRTRVDIQELPDHARITDTENRDTPLKGREGAQP